MSAPFPPRHHLDVRDYDSDDVLQGYVDHRTGDPEPGENHAPGYRWGWANRRRDALRQPDGLDPIRYAYARMLRQEVGAHPGPPPAGARPDDEFFHAVELQHAAYRLDRGTEH